MSDAQPRIRLPRGSLAYLTENGTTVVFDDRGVSGYGEELRPVERAVLAVRLRGWADLIENDNTDTTT